MTFEGIQKLAEKRKESRKRRVIRLLTQFNLKFMLVLMTGACIVALNGPRIWNHYQDKYNQMISKSQQRQILIGSLKASRPVATKYRNDEFSPNECGFVLHGECLVNGVWKRYVVASRDGKTTSYAIELPITK